MKLVKPSIEHLPAYEVALKRGWSPDNLRPEFAQEQIEEISKDAVSFVSKLDDPGGEAGPLTLPDGSKVKRAFRQVTGRLGPSSLTLRPRVGTHPGSKDSQWR